MTLRYTDKSELMECLSTHCMSTIVSSSTRGILLTFFDRGCRFDSTVMYPIENKQLSMPL